MKRCVLILLACAVLTASCRGGGANVALASLTRSAKIQLLCIDAEPGMGNTIDITQLLPLAICSAEDDEVAESVQRNLTGGVTQAETGEVVIVNFTRNRVLDTNRSVPGVTPIIVGEQPTGIQISPFEPGFTYVSSFSPRTVQAIPTDEVLGLSTGILAFEDVLLDGGPTDLALHEQAGAIPVLDGDDNITGALTGFAYRYLYAPIPELGQIAQIPVIRDPDGKHEALGPPQLLDLGTFSCDTVTFVPSPESTPDDYNRICPSEPAGTPAARFVKTVRTTQTCIDGDGTGPRPQSVTVDYGAEQGAPPGLDTGDDSDDVLLVADANQPVIHRFALGENGATPLDPIVTGTPTTQAVATPFVPATSDPEDRTAVDKYIYAVAAFDGSVLAIEYSPDSPDFGAVLPVLAGVSARANEENVESRDRVRSGFLTARSIEVISPQYELETVDGALQVPEMDSLCNPNDPDAFAAGANSRNMRGVFLSVALSDGRLFFLDVYDLNAPCRGGEGSSACTAAESGPDALASIRRHRRRFRQAPTELISIEGTPSLRFDTQTGRIDEASGDTPTSDGPGLTTIDCPTSMFTVFGGNPIINQGLICSSSQVWSNVSQRWDATWEGLIPNSEGGLGLFADEFEGEAGEWFVAGDVPLCRVGVLGEGVDLELGLPAPYAGDRLLITGELPPATRDDPACADFVDLDERLDEFPVWFPIVRAFDDRLLIAETPSNDYTLAQVKGCFTQFTEYQINTQGAYAVVGNASGFINRVIPGPDDECILDASRPIEPGDVDTFLNARAFGGAQYVNPLVSFEIQAFSDEVTVSDTTIAVLNFNIFNQFVIEVFDAGAGAFALPASQLFSPSEDELFYVDFEGGVRRIGFSSLSSIQNFE